MRTLRSVSAHLESKTKTYSQSGFPIGLALRYEYYELNYVKFTELHFSFVIRATFVQKVVMRVSKQSGRFPYERIRSFCHKTLVKPKLIFSSNPKSI